MAVKSIFQGHWRALENAWLEYLKRESDKEKGNVYKIAVVVAGQPLSKHLLSKINFTTAGITFFPGIPKLAEALASTITTNKIPFSNLISLAALSDCRATNIKASAKFFEKMLEMGVTSEIFNIVTQSIRGIHQKVIETSQLFSTYSKLRNRYYPCATSNVMQVGPQNPSRFQLYIFYGFYDLNPAQKLYIESLAGKAEIVWFSPLHSSHHFAAPFQKTANLLTKLSSRPPERVDLTTKFRPIAQFGKNLLTKKTLIPNNNIELIQCGSGMGFTKAVSQLVQSNLNSFRPEEITVIASGEDAKQIATELYCCGVPSTPPISVQASHLPAGAFIKKLLALPKNSFHHKDIEKLLLSLFIKIENTPDAVAFTKHANVKGARFGLAALQATGYSFALNVADFFQTIPDEAKPSVYLSKLKLLLNQLSCNTIPAVFSDDILGNESFLPEEKVSFDVFVQMIDSALESPIPLADKGTDAVSILPLEKARGISSKIIIITGMEEGLFPRPGINDPRLPAELKKHLQLPSLDTKEMEDGYLLSQLFEAAEMNLTLVTRDKDTKGKPLALSHFIQPLKNISKAVRISNYSDTPLNILKIPSNPPFLKSSLKAQKERLLFDPDNPSEDAMHSGMIGPNLYKIDHITATALENYLHNPYNFLLDRIWKVSEEDEFPIVSQPAPKQRGTIVHKCVEEALNTSIPISKIIDSVCQQNNLVELLGSSILADMWKEQLTAAVKKLKDQISDLGWTLVEAEKTLHGSIAGFPATGKVDLIFKDDKNNYILADLKTGKAKIVRNTKSITILKNNLLQLPFYRNLALQNNYNPLSLALYIHLESDGSITFAQLTDKELETINSEFEDKVRETVQSMVSGDFHKPLIKKFKK